MATGAQVAIGVRPGYATTTTCQFMVVSLTNGAITLVTNGVSYGPTVPVATDTDNAALSPAGYTTQFTATGLTAFTKYTYTVSQAGNTGTSSGSFMTAPKVDSNFSFFLSGCDNALPGAGTQTGFWDKVRAYATTGALPTVGHIFVDDHGYVAEMSVADTGFSGKVTSGAQTFTNGKVYDYALGYIAALGMLGNTTNVPIFFGRDADRSWCNQNLNYIPQWGDHEFANDIGWDFPVNGTATLGSYTGLGFTSSVLTGATAFANGKTAWDEFHLKLQPPCRGTGIALIDINGAPVAGQTGANTTIGANHWGITWGCVNIVAPDGITHADGQWNHAQGAIGTLNGKYPGTLYGSNQIKDCLNFVHNTSIQPFNIWALGFGMRNISSGTESPNGNGTQHPIDHVNLAAPFAYDPGTKPVGSFREVLGNNENPGNEYQQMFTGTADATYKSVMNSPQGNGKLGVTVVLHGDYHRQMVTRNNHAAYTGNLAEMFYSVWNGTTNGTTNFNFNAPGLTTGTTTPGGGVTVGTAAAMWAYDGTDLIYNSAWTNVVRRYGGLRVDVYGSKVPRELHAILMDETGAEMWHGRWLERSGNEVFPTTWVKSSTGTSPAKLV